MRFINSTGYSKLFDDKILERVWFTFDINQISFKGDEESWLLAVRTGNSIRHLKKAMPSDILDRIINSNLHLVLYNQFEAFHDVVEPIYQYAIAELGIPEDKIILLTGSPDIAEDVKLVANKLGKKEFKCKFFNFFEWVILTDKKHWIEVGNTILTLKNKHYDKKFINFNRRWRRQRPTLIAMLYSMEILNKGYISLSQHAFNHGWNDVWDDVMFHANDEIRSMIGVNKESICNLPDMYLDTTDLDSVYSVQKRVLDIGTDYLYTSSYFSLVSETNFYDDQPGRFLTEKTYKPIAQQHPFILIARPHSLKFLYSLGYKTFSPFIDESYDSELDNNKRLLMIAKETERLSNLNPAELENFLDGVRNICKHNLEVMLNRTDFIIDLN